MRSDHAAADATVLVVRIQPVLSARDLTLRRGPEPLFEQVNFTVFRGNKVGITGANGSGKSSLFAAIRGELHPDRGDIDRPAGTARSATSSRRSTRARAPRLNSCWTATAELRSVLAAIARGGSGATPPWRSPRAHAAYQSIDGYRARARGGGDHARARLQDGGSRPRRSRNSRAAGACVSGWRARCVRAPICCCSMNRPITWISTPSSGWRIGSRAFSGTLLMISHDREFLDAIIDRVLHIENRAIHAYAGNYSQFEQKRAEELAQQQALHARQVKRVAEITSFVNRFRASATKSRQAQSRMKMLERMERIVPGARRQPVRVRVRGAAQDAATAVDGRRRRLRLRQYPRRRAASTCRSVRYDRIALLGPNGAGKSTLTKMLAGEAAPLRGQDASPPRI